MQKLYDYYGLEIGFRNDSQLPITVYACRENRESASIITFKDGLINGLEKKDTPNPLDQQDQESFDLILDKNISEIIKFWLDIFLYKKIRKTEVIRTKLGK